MRRNCGRAIPRSAQMLPTFPSIKPSGGYHDGCGVERIRIEISRPSASKSKAASSRELMFAQASFWASSVRYDAVSTRHPPRPTDGSVDLSQTSDKCSYDTRLFCGSWNALPIPLAAENSKAYARFPRAIEHAASTGCPAATSSPQQSHVGTNRCCGTTCLGRVEFSARLLRTLPLATDGRSRKLVKCAWSGGGSSR